MTTPRTPRRGLVERPRPLRDATLFVVATEDTYASPQYFDALLANGVVDGRRVRIVTIPSEQGRSALNHLVEALEGHAATNPTINADERWIVFDTDRQRARELSAQALQATQKGYLLAGSNPCFELWLLLHETDDLSNIATCVECEGALRRVLGSYNKTRIDASRITASSVDDATRRARALDADSATRWPTSLGSHLHRLVARLPRRHRPDGSAPNQT